MKELKAELKRGILHGKIIYVMMMVAILFALGWTENLSQAIEFRENANVVFSSIKRVYTSLNAIVFIFWTQQDSQAYDCTLAFPLYRAYLYP